MDKWCICPNCGGNAIEISPLKGIDCPNCGHITARQLFKLMARIMRRGAEEAKQSNAGRRRSPGIT